VCPVALRANHSPVSGGKRRHHTEMRAGFQCALRDREGSRPDRRHGGRQVATGTNRTPGVEPEPLATAHAVATVVAEIAVAIADGD